MKKLTNRKFERSTKIVILYKPTAENKIFSETTWDEDLDENIFDYIRKSASFAYARNHEYIEVKIYMDET